MACLYLGQVPLPSFHEIVPLNQYADAPLRFNVTLHSTSDVGNLSATGHTEYVFVISANGKTWKVSRRYSEFLDLDTKLRQMFGKPTRPFPPLPEKKLFGSSSSMVVGERQAMLTAYLQVATTARPCLALLVMLSSCLMALTPSDLCQAVLENGILSSTAEVQRFIDMESTDNPPPPSVFRSNVPRGTPMG